MLPDTEILTYQGRRFSYGELERLAAGTATELTSQGVEPGDRLAILVTNGPATIGALFGVAAVGAVFVPLNFRARDHELCQMLDAVQPKAILAGVAYVDLAN